MGEDGRKRRRRRKCVEATEPMESNAVRTEIFKPEIVDEEEVHGIMQQAKDKRSRRECPLPKPGGRVGEFLGFKTNGSIMEESNTSRPP